VLEPGVARYRGTVSRLYFRGGAAFANPQMYEFLKADGAGYRSGCGEQRLAEQDWLPC
jgi:hypothetical protein